ncbi:helix-turn-helix transcriptional regulator [Promicromonospora sp. NPDC050880]|uniref:helix-turn-helix transcriptional regulator n=1 Tax=Promicromonospora sp. NPDC050880 TaxID=3364406 RepID=UPI00378B2CCA
MHRAQLATFLRGRRERIRPADVGLPAGRGRRTPGLRREEVAQLAFISTEYYTRLEQARGPHPSREVVGGLARALRLSDAERDHLHQLAGLPPDPPPGPPRTVRPSVQLMLDRLPQSAAFVTSALLEVIAWNGLAAALMEDFSALSRRDRNLARHAFLGSEDRADRLYGVSDGDEFARSAAARLRRTAARYPDDPEVAELVDDLLTGSPEFAALWAAGDVDTAPMLRKTFQHPVVGPVTVNCDALDLTDQDQHVVVYTADPGSPSDEALRLLAVIGTQHMSSAT